MSLRALNQASLKPASHGLLARLVSLWDQHQRAILTAAFVVVAAGVVGFFTLRARGQASAVAAERMSQATMDYMTGNFQRSLTTAQQVASQYGGTAEGLDALRLAGDCHFWLRNFKDAIQSYRRYLERDRQGVLADAARRSLANALESDRQFDEAARLFGEIAGRLDRESAADCLMAAARCHRAAGRNSEAAAIYRRVADDFGDTQPAATARVYLAELGAPQPK